MSSAEQKRLSKLPPRLAKQREQKEKEKQHARVQQNNNNILPKIENWDNEMANNIPMALPETITQEPAEPVPEPAVIQPPRSKCPVHYIEPYTYDFLVMPHDWNRWSKHHRNADLHLSPTILMVILLFNICALVLKLMNMYS